MKNYIELEEAIDLLIKNTKPIAETRIVPLIEALGQVADEDISAAFDNPPFNRSPLDGYAFCHIDSKGACKERPVRLEVVCEILAGGVSDRKMERGQAVRIMTGARIPEGCDCVIRQEDTDYGEDDVEIYCELKENQNFCFQGEDIQKGRRLVQRGDTLSYVHLGVLSSMGIEKVKIIRPAKVGLVCTGDELVPIGMPLTDGKIYDSNRYLLAGRLKDLGLDVITYPPVDDDAPSIAALIAKIAEETDVIITTGGVSVGKKDVMHQALSELKAKPIFWRVSFKPGTPALCGVYNDKPLICLSGNPFAAAATFELLARPVLSVVTGREELMYSRKKAILKDDYGKSSPGRRFIRARLVDGEVFLKEGHSSGIVFSMLGCNAMIDIAAGSPVLKRGIMVDVVVL